MMTHGRRPQALLYFDVSEEDRTMANETYEKLRAKVRQLQETGELSKELTAEEKINWAYGNTVIENSNVTVEMVQSAYTTKHPK
jgi:hypothetical protein